MAAEVTLTYFAPKNYLSLHVIKNACLQYLEGHRFWVSEWGRESERASQRETVLKVFLRQEVMIRHFLNSSDASTALTSIYFPFIFLLTTFTKSFLNNLSLNQFCSLSNTYIIKWNETSLKLYTLIIFTNFNKSISYFNII